jgi:hypothetical protein
LRHPRRAILTADLSLILTNVRLPFAPPGVSCLGRDLPHRPLDQHLRRLKAPLCHDLAVGQLGVAASVNPPWRKDVKVSSSRKPAARITFVTFRLLCVRSI